MIPNIPNIMVHFPQLVDHFDLFDVKLTPNQVRQLEILESPIPLHQAVGVLRKFYQLLRSTEHKRVFFEYFDPWNYDVSLPTWNNVVMEYVGGTDWLKYKQGGL